MATLDARERHTVNRGIPFTIGVLLILGGLFALYSSVFTSIVTVLYLGTLLIIVGILRSSRRCAAGRVVTEVRTSWRASCRSSSVRYAGTGQP